MNGTLYHHATIANAYVYQDAAGMLWQVPMQPGGWKHCKPYHGYTQSLRAMPEAQQRLLARTVGIEVDPSEAGKALASLRGTASVTCEVCGKPFTALQRQTQQPRTCSPACRQKLWRRHRLPKQA